MRGEKERRKGEKKDAKEKKQPTKINWPVVAAGVGAATTISSGAIGYLVTRSNNALEQERIRAEVELRKLENERPRLDGTLAQAMYGNEIEYAQQLLEQRHRLETEELIARHEEENNRLVETRELKERLDAERQAKLNSLKDHESHQRELNKQLYAVCYQMGRVAMESQRAVDAISQELARSNNPSQCYTTHITIKDEDDEEITVTVGRAIEQANEALQSAKIAHENAVNYEVLGKEYSKYSHLQSIFPKFPLSRKGSLYSTHSNFPTTPISRKSSIYSTVQPNFPAIPQNENSSKYSTMDSGFQSLPPREYNSKYSTLESNVSKFPPSEKSSKYSTIDSSKTDTLKGKRYKKKNQK
ncbi:hypothetical protein PENTCL1PPCAC_8163 [Pristionchus entomophagus]|uniref:Uncharacterized protein n=1 Tax=Pristionchus entomophagus TaxID=358040 RepID=A0AAV5SV91_9BILA|nr:hypothetical protein PENTCL1PPCAC_8163 [Pristionchus entomophagus]